MRNTDQIDEAVCEALYQRCPTFKEDMLRVFQTVLCTLESWVPTGHLVDGLFLRISEFVGKVRCYFYGHHFVIDQSNQMIHCISCAKIKDYG